MKKQLIASLAVLLLAPLLAAAQSMPTMIVANIDFAFHAEDKVMPAGTYDFRMDESESVVTMMNEKTGDSIIIPVIARLDQLKGDEATVEFEKIGDQYYISQLHAPDMDGFQLGDVPAQQTHVSVKAVKK